MNTTRIDNDTAEQLVWNDRITAHHALVTDKGRIVATEKQGTRGYRFWFGEKPNEWVGATELRTLLATTNAHVELEAPSPFETRLINAIDNLNEAKRIAPCEDTRECVEGAIEALGVALKFVEKDRVKVADSTPLPTFTEATNPELCRPLDEARGGGK